MTNLINELQEYKGIKEQLQRYQNILSSSPVGIYSTTLKGDILYVNDAILEIFEFESVEEMAQQNALQRYKNPSDRK